MVDAKNVLIVGHTNTVRSVMAEAILRQRGTPRVHVFSAGIEPATRADANTMKYLQSMGWDTSWVQPKDWNMFATPNAPRMDFVITLCSLANKQISKAWPGDPTLAFWYVPMPDQSSGDESLDRVAIAAIYARVLDRMTLFLGIDFDNMVGAALRTRLDAIGRIDDDARIARAGAIT